MKFSFVDFVLNKFEAEAEGADKGKVNLLTAMNMGWLVPTSSYGIAHLFEIDPSSIFGFALLLFMALLLFRPIKFWHVCRSLNEVEEEENPKPRKRETQN
ncbi:MAG: hypothetical protein WC495_07340, partial [Patescibacteria group bacterium]